MGKVLAGTAELRVDNRLVKLREAFTYSIMDEEAEPFKGMDGHFGVSFKPIPVFIEATISDESDLPLSFFKNQVGIVVVGRLRNGKTVTISNATQTKQAINDPGESKVPLRWDAEIGTEDLPSG